MTDQIFTKPESAPSTGTDPMISSIPENLREIIEKIVQDQVKT